MTITIDISSTAGKGKTTVAVAIAQLLQEHGFVVSVNSPDLIDHEFDSVWFTDNNRIKAIAQRTKIEIVETQTPR